MITMMGKLRRPGLLVTTATVAFMGQAQHAMAQAPQEQTQPEPQSQSSAEAGTAAPDLADGIHEIIVTANKRRESINTVGLTISAATGDQLAARGIEGPEDLAKLVTGFTATKSIYATPVYTLRGIGLYDGTFGASPSVSIYTDQVPRNFPVMSDGLDLDLERVEVLKGPQGTLFGQSSTGGAINYIVGKPTMEFHAGGELSVERFDRFEGSAFLSGPLGENVQARLAMKAINGGAWQYSISRPNDDIGATRKYMGRLTVDLQPSERFDVQLMVAGSKDRSDPQASQYVGTNFNIYGSEAQLAAANANPATRNPFGFVDATRYADLSTPTSPGFDSSFLNRQAIAVRRLNGADAFDAAGARAILGTPLRPNSSRAAEWTPGLLGKSDNSYYQLIGKLEYELTDTITVTSLSAYARSKIDYPQDLDGTTGFAIDILAEGDIKTLNQELRVAGDLEGINWIFGGSYDNLKAFQRSTFNYSQYTGNDPLGTNLQLTRGQSDLTTKLRSYAVFGNIEYEVTPRLTVQGGVRYTKNKLNAAYCYSNPAFDTDQYLALTFTGLEVLFSGPGRPPLTSSDCIPLGDGLNGTTFGVAIRDPLRLKLNEDNVSLRGGLNYKFDQGTLLYATVSQGYKAGIFSALDASSTAQYSPATQEKVIAYEAGFKAPLADRRVQLNAAGFYYDYSDKQIRGQVFDQTYGLLQKLINIPKSYSYGAEAEVNMELLEGLRLSFGGTYLKSKVTSDFDRTPEGLTVYNSLGYTGNFKGSKLPFTPEFSGNADAQYDVPISDAIVAFVGGTVVYQSSVNTTFENAVLRADSYHIDGYETVDLRAGISGADESWRLTIYGRNVFNKHYTTSISSYLDTRIRYTGRPAIYGLSFSYRM